MKLLRKYISILLCITLLLTSIFVSGVFAVPLDEVTHTGIVNTPDSVLRIRSSAGTSHSSLGQLAHGATVNLCGIETVDGDGLKWYKIAYGNDYGYVCADYITGIKSVVKYDYNADFETNMTNQGFPESYKVLLRQLHASHPNWIFTADHLAMTWAEAVANECTVGRTLVHSTAKNSWKSMMLYAYDWGANSYVSYDTGGWVTAEREVVEYFMEPRNFLDENNVFMFLDQTYNPSLQNRDGLQKILNGTFMEGAFPEDTHATYGDVIMEAAEKTGVSPYVLAASIIIEQGVNGSGASISGTNPGYEGYYNYFNVRAYQHGGYTAVAYGLEYAKGSGSLGRPWNTRAKSIIGGAEHYANGYVKRGQDNLYYKKFNVITPSYYVNQYMTNVQGAYLEAAKLKSAYSTVNADAQLTFAIPVYKEMPEQNLTGLPTSNGANNYYLTSITVDGQPIGNFNMYTNEYEMIVANSSSAINITATVPSGATVSGTGDISLAEGMNKVVLTVTAESGKTAKYTLSVYRETPGGGTAGTTISTDYNITTYLSGVEVGTDASTFLSKISSANGVVKLYNASGGEKTEGVISTGDKVAILDPSGQICAAYSISIFGDTNGDGKISIMDLAKVQKHLLEVSALTDIYNISADINHDGKVSILDLAMVQKHLLEIKTITQ